MDTKNKIYTDIYSRTEKAFSEYLDQKIKLIIASGFEKSHPLYIPSLNKSVESFAINTKEMFNDVKLSYINENGAGFLTTMEYYNIINKVIDSIYPNFNKEWENQKKYSNYLGPDMDLMSY